MADFITCAYSIKAVGNMSAAALEATMAAVPVDLTLPNLYGLLYIADSTAIDGAVVTRTMQFRMTPTSEASLTCTLVPGDGSGSPVDILTVAAPGANYAGIPYPFFAPSNDVQPFRRARAKCIMGAGGSTILKPGSGYTSATVTFTGGQLAPGGTQATGHVTVVEGGVTDVVVDDPGGPYNVPPTAMINGGTGALVTVGLQVVRARLLDPGGGYHADPPTITLTNPFALSFKDDPVPALANFMKGEFQKALQSPVFAATPTIS